MVFKIVIRLRGVILILINERVFPVINPGKFLTILRQISGNDALRVKANIIVLKLYHLSENKRGRRRYWRGWCR